MRSGCEDVPGTGASDRKGTSHGDVVPCASRDLTSSRRWRCCRRDSASLCSAGDASNIAKSRLQERRASCEGHSETEWRGDDEACKDLREEALLGAASTAVVSSRGAPTTSGTEPRRDPASRPLAKASQAARKRMSSELLSPSEVNRPARRKLPGNACPQSYCLPSVVNRPARPGSSLRTWAQKDKSSREYAAAEPVGHNCRHTARYDGVELLWSR